MPLSSHPGQRSWGSQSVDPPLNEPRKVAVVPALYLRLLPVKSGDRAPADRRSAPAYQSDLTGDRLSPCFGRGICLGAGGRRNLGDAVDIADWLRSLSLGQYAPAFAEKDPLGVLPKLTADDLKEIGVAAVGDRHRLLEAIASLGGGGLPAVSAAVPSAVFGGAERRQLTVVFCDLVGSTALSARYDPEDLREIVGAYHRCVADTIARFLGFVAKYMGDGVLIRSPGR